MGAGTEHEIPPPVAMMGLITGYWVSQAVGAVALLGVADHFGNGPRSSDDLARDVEADPQALFRVLRLLASIGVFAEVAPRSFGLTALGETLRSDTPGSVPQLRDHGDRTRALAALGPAEQEHSDRSAHGARGPWDGVIRVVRPEPR
jgi:hypothetical protein